MTTPPREHPAPRALATATTRMRRGLVALGALVMAAGTVMGAAPAAAASAQSLYVSPEGRGMLCALQAPCTLATAVTVARAGATITMLEGDYGAQHLTRG